MRTILLRIAIIVFAVGFTAITFGGWGEFSRAMNNYLTLVYKDEPAKPAPQEKGVVTMTIVQPITPINKVDCRTDKAHPCPKP